VEQGLITLPEQINVKKTKETIKNGQPGDTGNTVHTRYRRKINNTIPQSVNSKDNNTMANTKRKNRQTMVSKTLHRKLRIEQHDPH
jgi:hypothetical protein